MPFLLSLFGGASTGAAASGNAFTQAVANIDATNQAAQRQNAIFWGVGIVAGLAAVGLGIYLIATKDH